MLALKIVSALLVIILLSFGCALDVSFIPNDENAPLPLSHKYRESLRKLCSLVRGGGRLPEELQEKRAVLEKMCAKLAKDDDNIESAEVGGLSKWDLKTIAFTLLGVGSGYAMWNNRHWIKMKANALFNNAKVRQVDRTERIVADGGVLGGGEQFRPLGEGDPINMRILEAREARLRRFAEINVNANANINMDQ